MARALLIQLQTLQPGLFTVVGRFVYRRQAALRRSREPIGGRGVTDQGLMARKPLDDIIRSGEADGPKLSKTLGAFSITGMGIGAIIGAGIFVLTGTAAAQYAGPSIVLSFIVGGIACGFVGLCYSELAAMLPISGSSYTYTYATLGELFAWMIGWDLILEYAMGAATVAVGWSGYAVSMCATSE